MLARFFSSIRERWHPLWRLRKSPLYRRFQDRCDLTVETRIPATGIRVAVKLLRDASWITQPAGLEPEIRQAFALVLDLVRPRVFWDVGANIGFYSWMVRQHPGVEQVLMFEPDPTNFGLLQRTIRRNSIENCRTFNLALAECTGEDAFLVDRASGATGSLQANAHRDNTFSLQHAYGMGDVITCRTAAADDLIRDGALPPDLMKIDVEGAERRVLAGAKECLSCAMPALIIETGDLDLMRDLAGAGYRVFRIDHGNFLALPLARGLDFSEVERAFAPLDPVP